MPTQSEKSNIKTRQCISESNKRKKLMTLQQAKLQGPAPHTGSQTAKVSKE